MNATDRIRRAMLAVALALGVSAAATAQPVDVEGVKFEPTVQVGDKALVLNGAGLRTRFGFRVYAAGLYVPAKATDAKALLEQTGPRRMAITIMRELDGETFAKALSEGLANNLSDAQLASFKDRIAQLDGIVRAVPKVAKGDTILFDLGADDATRVVINGQPRGAAIPGADFYAAVLRVWLGDKPADSALRKALLGG